MHDLNTIIRLNNEACQDADYWRKRGKWVVRTTAGVHVTDVCTFDTFEQAQADPLRWKQVEIRATLLRNREWRATLGLPVPTVPKGRTQHHFTLPPGTPRIF